MKNVNLTIKCRMCKTIHTIGVPKEDLDKYNSGNYLIQDVFPYLCPGTRELIISQTCEECFDKLFK